MVKKISKSNVYQLSKLTKRVKRQQNQEEADNLKHLDEREAHHDLCIAERQALEAELALNNAKRRVTEAKLRCAEIKIMHSAQRKAIWEKEYVRRR